MRCNSELYGFLTWIRSQTKGAYHGHHVNTERWKRSQDLWGSMSGANQWFCFHPWELLRTTCRLWSFSCQGGFIILWVFMPVLEWCFTDWAIWMVHIGLAQYLCWRHTPRVRSGQYWLNITGWLKPKHNKEGTFSYFTHVSWPDYSPYSYDHSVYKKSIKNHDHCVFLDAQVITDIFHRGSIS